MHTTHRGSVKLIAVLALGVIALGGLGLYMFLGGSSTKGTSARIEFGRPETQVFVGQPFTVGISFSNISDSILKDVQVSVALPDELSLVGNDEQRLINERIGDLGPGSIGQRTFNLIAQGQGDAIKTLSARLVYVIAGSKAQFEQDATLDIPVSGPAVVLSFEAPQKVASGQNFDVVFTYRNNSQQEIKNARLEVQYPPSFKYQKATRDPSSGNSMWTLGTIPPGGNGTLTVTGSLLAPDQAFFDFIGTVMADHLGTPYAIAQQKATVAISSSPLVLDILANDSKEYAPSVGDTVNYTLYYRNNSTVTFEGVTIKASLSGELFDLSTVGTNGVFNSITNSITWLAANTPALRSVAPGEEGFVNLRVKLKDAFPIQRVSDKNYTVKITADIQSPTVPEGTTADRTIGVASLESKVRGKMSFDSFALYRDAQAGIVNGGEYPPRANQPTQYTIHWKIVNYATDVSNVRVTASLQSGARCTGIRKSTVSGSEVSCNPNTGEVVWEIPMIPATRGVVSAPTEAIFQIEHTPAITDVGRPVQLVSDARLEATDTFTNSPISLTDRALDTNLFDDPTIPQGSSRNVQP